jgi:hypothetical protein
LDLVSSRIVTPARGVGPVAQSRATAVDSQRSRLDGFASIASRGLAFRSNRDRHFWKVVTLGMRDGFANDDYAGVGLKTGGITTISNTSHEVQQWQARSGYSGLRLRHPKKDHPLVTYQLVDLGPDQDLALATSKAVKARPAIPCVQVQRPLFIPSLQPRARTKRRMDKSLHFPTFVSMSFFSQSWPS